MLRERLGRSLLMPQILGRLEHYNRSDAFWTILKMDKSVRMPSVQGHPPHESEVQ